MKSLAEHLDELLPPKNYKGNILEEVERILIPWRHPYKRHHAHHLAFTFKWKLSKSTGESMTFTMPPLNAAGQPSTVAGTVSPVKADGSPSLAVLSALSYTSSDPTVFTVAPDPSTPNGFIVTAVNTTAGGTAILTGSGTATEADGVTTEPVTGAVTVVIATPPPAPAAALVFNFGTPQ